MTSDLRTKLERMIAGGTEHEAAIARDKLARLQASGAIPPPPRPPAPPGAATPANDGDMWMGRSGIPPVHVVVDAFGNVAAMASTTAAAFDNAATMSSSTASAFGGFTFVSVEAMRRSRTETP